MNRVKRNQRLGLLVSLLIPSGIPDTISEGIPEPSLVLYGVVENLDDNSRLIVGSMEWTFQPTANGSLVVAKGALSNINDQFSYVLFVPMESAIPGQPATPNTLPLPSSPTSYDRSQVLVNGEPASLVNPDLGTLILTSAGRGMIHQIDLTVSVVSEDADGNGLPDAWEQAFFGQAGVDPNDDPDNDGLTNEEEWKAGTDPNDAQSQFAFINIEALPQAGILIDWSSAPGKRYSILRSSQIMGDFTPIETALEATGQVSSYLDSTAVVERTYFYLLRVED